MCWNASDTESHHWPIVNLERDQIEILTHTGMFSQKYIQVLQIFTYAQEWKKKTKNVNFPCVYLKTTEWWYVAEICSEEKSKDEEF